VGLGDSGHARRPFFGVLYICVVTRGLGVSGHAWSRVQHDNTVTWLACWKENILNSVKYVMLSASSSFKGKSDMEKYDKVSMEH
jgi:hypothetical protein